LEEVLAADPAYHAARFERASVLARRGQWKEASDEFDKALQGDPSNPWHWYRSACLALHQNDHASLRRHCQELLTRFGATEDPLVADRVAKASLMSAGAVESLEKPVALAERAIPAKHAPALSHGLQLGQGMAAYRAGKHAEAIAILEKARQAAPANRPDSVAAINAYLAMAHHKEGHREAAREALARADEAIQQLPSDDASDFGAGWADWILCKQARKEAEEVSK
jgi:tetratricopeptide (TPR) repeat protein